MVAPPATKKFQKSYFDVLGLCCSSEVPLIENILKALDGIKEVSVIVPSRTVIVIHDDLLISQLQILKALNQAKLEANVRMRGETNYRNKWPSPYAMVCGLLLLMSLLKYLYHPMQWVAIGAVAIGVFPIARKAIVSLKNFRLDINILALVAAAGSICLKDYVEAATIVFLFTIAEWLESRASHKATAVMSSLMSMAPTKAVIAETGEEVDAADVKVNTILAVKAGKAIPIDGIVVEGECEVDEKALTGESFPVAKLKDSTVLAGTINLNGYISVKTTVLAEDSAVARMAVLVEEAQNKKSTTQRFIDKCAKYYTPAVFLISVCIAVVPAALRVHNQSHWFHLALVVLVSGCPCALILSTPVATFCGLSKAATTGLLIKGGDYLEILAKIKVMAFDKTGTITRGEFTVTDFRSLHDDISFNTLLYWVSSIESKSSHPLAAALVDYGRSHSVEPTPEAVEEFHNYPGAGVHGRIDGRDVYIGNKIIAQRAECKTDLTTESNIKELNTIGYIFCGATLVGKFSLSDACRTGVAEAMKELKRMGIRTAMLTGDSQTSATSAQDQLQNALEEVHAELLPEDKARLIEGFKKEGWTAMVGDGINDAPALATADIGISMGITGSALATETAHVILMSNDIRKIPKAVRLSRKCNRKVFENVILAISTKAAILALAISGRPLVWAAVLADVGTCVLVILNSMLLLQGTHQHREKCCKKKSETRHQHGFDSCCSGPSTCEKKKCGGSNENKDDISTRGIIHHEERICENSCCHSLPLNHVDCEEDGGLHEEKQKHGASGCCSTISHDHVASHRGENHCSHKHTSSGTDHKLVSSNHCETLHCQKNHVKEDPDGSSCGSLSEKEAACCKKRNHGKHHKESSVKDEMSSNHAELTAIDACPSLEKRDTGGCGKSYRKECCGHKRGHLGIPFATGLSVAEVVSQVEPQMRSFTINGISCDVKFRENSKITLLLTSSMSFLPHEFSPP